MFISIAIYLFFFLLGQCWFEKEYWANWSTTNWLYKHCSHNRRFRSCNTKKFPLRKRPRLFLFQQNITAIRDFGVNKCFIMPLDRQHVPNPANLIETFLAMMVRSIFGKKKSSIWFFFCFSRAHSYLTMKFYVRQWKFKLQHWPKMKSMSTVPLLAVHVQKISRPIVSFQRQLKKWKVELDWVPWAVGIFFISRS